MDVTTLRIAFAVLAGVLVVLFYTAAYRPTGSAFSRWWTWALALFLCSAVAFTANGTPAQVVLNPLGNGLGVGGAAAVWSAARSLHTRPVRRRWLLIGPLVAVLAGAADDPAHNTWAGGLTFLVLMSAGFGAAGVEMRAAARSLTERTVDRRDTDARGLRLLCAALGCSSALVAAYYAVRAVAYQWTGPFSHTFTTYFGAATTTLFLIVQLAVVSFSMSSLSTLQHIADLRRRAVYDQLTGLMRAQEFRRHAAVVLPHLARQGEIAIVAMADFDHFKDINDQLGHRAGDDVLRAFGRAAAATIGRSGMCGRLGGDEFALLFPAISLDDAERHLAAMIEQFERSVTLADGRLPTLSIGVATADDQAPLGVLLDRADKALYRAKTTGRARAVHG